MQEVTVEMVGEGIERWSKYVESHAEEFPELRGVRSPEGLRAFFSSHPEASALLGYTPSSVFDDLRYASSIATALPSERDLLEKATESGIPHQEIPGTGSLATLFEGGKGVLQNFFDNPPTMEDDLGYQALRWKKEDAFTQKRQELLDASIAQQKKDGAKIDNLTEDDLLSLHPEGAEYTCAKQLDYLYGSLTGEEAKIDKDTREAFTRDMDEKLTAKGPGFLGQRDRLRRKKERWDKYDTSELGNAGKDPELRRFQFELEQARLGRENSQFAEWRKSNPTGGMKQYHASNEYTTFMEALHQNSMNRYVQKHPQKALAYAKDADMKRKNDPHAKIHPYLTGITESLNRHASFLQRHFPEEYNDFSSLFPSENSGSSWEPQEKETKGNSFPTQQQGQKNSSNSALGRAHNAINNAQNTLQGLQKNINRLRNIAQFAKNAPFLFNPVVLTIAGVLFLIVVLIFIIISITMGNQSTQNAAPTRIMACREHPQNVDQIKKSFQLWLGFTPVFDESYKKDFEAGDTLSIMKIHDIFCEAFQNDAFKKMYYANGDGSGDITRSGLFSSQGYNHVNILIDKTKAPCLGYFADDNGKESPGGIIKTIKNSGNLPIHYSLYLYNLDACSDDQREFLILQKLGLVAANYIYLLQASMKTQTTMFDQVFLSKKIPTQSCTYNVGEEQKYYCMADALGEYAVYPNYRDSTVAGDPTYATSDFSNYQTAFPAYYNYIKENFFGGEEFFTTSETGTSTIACNDPIPVDAENDFTKINALLLSKYGVTIVGRSATVSRAKEIYNTMCLQYLSKTYQQLLNATPAHPIQILLDDNQFSCGIGLSGKTTGENNACLNKSVRCSAVGWCDGLPYANRFVLSHELAHHIIIDNINGIFSSFQKTLYSTNAKNDLQTFNCQIGPSDAECFPDMIGEYLTYQHYIHDASLHGNKKATFSDFKTGVFASWYDFAKKNIFDNIEYDQLNSGSGYADYLVSEISKNCPVIVYKDRSTGPSFVNKKNQDCLLKISPPLTTTVLTALQLSVNTDTSLQCVGFARAVAFGANGADIGLNNAKDYAYTPAAKGYIFIGNTANATIQLGDIPIWDYGDGGQHIAVVTKVYGTTRFEVAEANGGSGTVDKANSVRNDSTLKGWLRFKGLN